MLSRTADSLFWLARYMERAENMARFVDMGRRMSAMPGSGPHCLTGHRQEWPAVLAATGCTVGYNELRWSDERYAPLHETMATIRYLLLEPSNASSVQSCFDGARFNARSVRGALTREMWEAVNDAWIQFRALKPEEVNNGSLSPLLDWIKTSVSQFRGAADGSALRNDGYEFLRLGFAVERLDCIARLLDVKTAEALIQDDDGVSRRYRWVALLRAAGQLLAYHAHYRADYSSARIADFLIKGSHSPRSLLHAALRAEEHLNALGALYGERAGCMDEARALTAHLRGADIEALLDDGLHAFLSEAIRLNTDLAAAIAESYHFGPARPTAQAETQAEETEEAKAAARAAPPEPNGHDQRRQDHQATNGAAQRQSQSLDARLDGIGAGLSGVLSTSSPA
ncbi:MAG: alpha-E domain-containing protein [Pseudomonadota bacterium]